jgi:NAD(P)-dependent dehydrogenase (short-subunit alcohol dehydrogenase family)
VGGQIAIPTHSAYHAAKWGLEGFSESGDREVSGFGIRLTLVEPGGIRTGFKNHRVACLPRHTCGLRAAPTSRNRDNALTGDPRKIAAVIFQTTRDADPPRRLTLGDDSYAAVPTALAERLADLEGQGQRAQSVAFGGLHGTDT